MVPIGGDPEKGVGALVPGGAASQVGVAEQPKDVSMQQFVPAVTFCVYLIGTVLLIIMMNKHLSDVSEAVELLEVPTELYEVVDDWNMPFITDIEVIDGAEHCNDMFYADEKEKQKVKRGGKEPEEVTRDIFVYVW